ncbi:unnamed protein product [Alternaria alternata]
MKEELERIAKAGGRSKLEPAPGEVEPKDPLAMLKRMSLQDLSAYVSGQTEALNNAHVSLEEKRSKGLHKISSRTQSFVSEFDRFVNAYSGIVNIVITLETTLACLTFQLLEQNPKVVRKVEEWYKIKKLISRRGSGRVEALSEALLGIIGLQEQPVFVVIDRPELSEADPASEFAETILRMVEQTDGVLKALIIHRAEFWDWEQNKSLILRKGTPASACQALRLDQRRL